MFYLIWILKVVKESETIIHNVKSLPSLNQRRVIVETPRLFKKKKKIPPGNYKWEICKGKKYISILKTWLNVLTM